MLTNVAGLLALASAASAQVKGFNYGSMFSDDSAKLQADYESDFTTAQNLVGTSGFTSARLYTMIVGRSVELLDLGHRTSLANAPRPNSKPTPPVT
jgi:glucan endo-1,3-beta-D-glucosidase